MENEFYDESPEKSTRGSFDNNSGESFNERQSEKPKRTISDPNRGVFERKVDFSNSRERSFDRERSFNRDDRGERGGFNRERSFNRDDRGERGGFNRERSFNRDDRGGERGGFNRERSFNRDDRGGERGGFNRERSFNRDDRGGERGGFNRERSFNRDDRGGERGGFNRERSFNRDDRGGERGGFNRERSFNRDDRGGFYSPFEKKKSYGGGFNDRNDNSNRTLRPRKNRGEEFDRPKIGAGLGPKYIEEPIDPEAEIRLNKYIANSGVCSRREADNHILAGEITVNGEVVTTLGTKIKMGDEVQFNGTIIKGEKKVYLILNKPKGYVTSVDDPHAEKTVMELIKGACNERVYPVGRLDKSTTGVLLLTNDGELTKTLTHPTYNKKKIYHVFLDKRISEEDMERIATGVDLDDGVAYADAISYVDGSDKSQVGVEIHSGKNRIIRRLFDTIGYKVIKLDRVYFAGLTKKGLPRGRWRFLTQREVGMLKMGSYE
ncbi:pseudouridine synthase [Acetobacteroides hydrogenigenes]|uniref:Pseudouridine synthase n=1 Tax=Acetobacteroides hydrogenigenes TaxID=979970 RepID=A0A4R2ERW5_9BACT|nr:pseudouridine synthase [Acetobacteroides hydrogenigenes]TCN70172.1 23S rRNA pseudouridine2605 synthase [Acetobacteroides hydrogenigenes]